VRFRVVDGAFFAALFFAGAFFAADTVFFVRAPAAVDFFAPALFLTVVVFADADFLAAGAFLTAAVLAALFLAVGAFLAAAFTAGAFAPRRTTADFSAEVSTATGGAAATGAAAIGAAATAEAFAAAGAASFSAPEAELAMRPDFARVVVRVARLGGMARSGSAGGACSARCGVDSIEADAPGAPRRRRAGVVTLTPLSGACGATREGGGASTAT
jgi:hypothetical protein